ncbi:hypothetical protein C9439_05915 [archaeon SCG-AAA382B04]|nr:hypothetical protein C9439_05915 [archaeon SCG-AAA382B04]
MFEIIFWTSAIVVGTAILVKGADMLVDSSGRAARYFGVPTIIVGLTLVALGTSLPELASSLNATLIEKSGISLGNVIGSNIANVLLVLGLTSVINPIDLEDGIFKREIPIMILVFIAFLFVLFTGETVNLLDGIFLLIFFLAYLFIFGKLALKSEDRTKLEKEISDERYVDISDFEFKNEVFMIFISLFLVILGSQLLIKGSIFYLEEFNLTQSFVGLSIVSISTSLPEMAASASAAYKSESDILLGNIIGSNTFNILFVIGICSLFLPLAISTSVRIVSLVMLLSGLVLAIFMFTGKRLSRLEGIIMLISYFIFLYVVYSWI